MHTLPARRLTLVGWNPPNRRRSPQHPVAAYQAALVPVSIQEGILFQAHAAQVRRAPRVHHNDALYLLRRDASLSSHFQRSSRSSRTPACPTRLVDARAAPRLAFIVLDTSRNLAETRMAKAARSDRGRIYSGKRLIRNTKARKGRFWGGCGRRGHGPSLRGVRATQPGGLTWTAAASKSGEPVRSIRENCVYDDCLSLFRSCRPPVREGPGCPGTKIWLLTAGLPLD